MVPAGDTLPCGGEQISPSGARMFITPIWILSELLQMALIDFKDLSSVKKWAIGSIALVVAVVGFISDRANFRDRAAVRAQQIGFEPFKHANSLN
jgi:hypothetical protein